MFLYRQTRVQPQEFVFAILTSHVHHFNTIILTSQDKTMWLVCQLLHSPATVQLTS